MIAASHPDDTTKPSRINRRRKKRWKNGLTNFYQADILNPLPHCSTGLVSRNTSGTAAIKRFFCARKLLSSSSLCRAGWAAERLAGARTGRPTYPVRLHDWSHVVGFTTLRDIIMKNHAQNPASSQTKQSLFSVYHNQNLIAFNVPGVLAFRLKQRKPAAIVKFYRMGGVA
jgi:hypothetical protein